MPTPSLFPVFLKAKAGDVLANPAQVFVETFGLDTVLETVDLELVELATDVEVVDVMDVALVDLEIGVDVVCTDVRTVLDAFDLGFDEGFG